jgi:DtxR family Mn-dependent transcriptional regulator
MLRYLAGCGIAPGDRFVVRSRQPFGGPLFLTFGGCDQTIGGALAHAMRVELDTARTPAEALDGSD